MSKAVAFVVTATLIVFGLMFSVLLLAVIVTVGAVAFGYLWYKTRALRRQMRENTRAMNGAANDADAFRDEVIKGEIIEGEVIRRVVSIEEIKR